ncbi:hypothetical protein [uncultured Enterovirga sp.]|uniref:hypothetical protein n=1 Tax=uncultured Enterovirga sp. TaxID=2026352 RepID=UPI0035CA0FE0
MSRSEGQLIVALGDRRYRVERPWGDIPVGAGMVSDVTVDSRGHVFALLRSDSLAGPPGTPVLELAPDGRRLASWGEDLIADGHMLACAPDDRLFIVDRDAHEVVICSTDGQRIGGLGRRHHPLEPFNHPSDVAIAQDGGILVSGGYADSRLHRFDADGSALGSFGDLGEGPGGFLNPHAVWVMPDGRVVVADRENDRLQVFDAAGRPSAIWRGFRQPLDIWGEADGTIFVTDLVPSLHMLAPDGTRLGRCRPVLNGAHGIWGGRDGHLYLAEPNPSRLTRLVPLNRQDWR